MPIGQLIVLTIIGIAALAWGASRDLKNHRKEKADQQAQKNPGL